MATEVTPVGVVLTEAIAVLAEADHPLHYREITERILRRGVWSTTGKTPEATVNAQLAVSIKQFESQSPFERVKLGVYVLRSGTSRPGIHVDNTQSANETDDAAHSDYDPPRKTLSFTDATEQVLDRFSKKSSMHYRDITEKILSLNLVATQGRTPEATLYFQVLTEIERANRRGDTPRFVRHGRGYIGLTKWNQQGLQHQVNQHNAEIKARLRQQLLEVHPADFEVLIGQLLDEIGFTDVIVTDQSGDGGIDVRGTLVVGEVIRTSMAVQVKRWKRNVQAPTVQQVRGSLERPS